MDEIEEENPRVSPPTDLQNSDDETLIMSHQRDTLQVNTKFEDANYMESASENIGSSSGSPSDLSGREGDLFDQTSSKGENKTSDNGSSLHFEGGSEASDSSSEGEEFFSSDERDDGVVIEDNKIIKVNPEKNELKVGEADKEEKFSKGEVEKRLSAKNLASDNASSNSKGTENWSSVKIDVQRERAAGNIAIVALDSEQEPASKDHESSFKTDSDMSSNEERKITHQESDLLPIGANNKTIERSSTKQYKCKNSFNELPKMIESKELPLHDKFVLLFATLLLKSERFNDSFDVCNIYGRRCLHENELTRANLYKLLALSTLEKGNEGYANRALKHWDKAIKKFKSIRCLEGKASCLLIKIHILQVIKYENNSDESEDESSDSNGDKNSSKIGRLITEVGKILPNIKTPFNEDQLGE